MKQLFASLLFTTFSSVVLAATFSGGGGQGTSIVDSVNPAGADYSSLSAAAQDFSSYGLGSTGNWTLLIRSDLTEPNNVAFGNNTGIHSVTLKPAPGISPTISFTTTTLENTGAWRGNLVVGTTSTTNLIDFVTTTSNFIIDGSNSVAGTTRDLTIRNANVSIASVVVRAVGACDGFTIKNCIVDNRSIGTGTANEAAGVELTSRIIAGADYHPVNAVIENCDIRSDVSQNGQSIIIRNSGTMNPGKAQSGHLITNNRLSATWRNIFISHSVDFSITNNTFIVNSVNNRPESINHASVNSVNGWTINILNNRWELIKNTRTTTPTGINYQFLAGAAGTLAVPVTGTYNIRNNFFGGFDYSGVTIASTGTAALYRAVVQSGNFSNVIMNIEHNSFNLPNFPGVTDFDTTGRFAAVAVTGSNPTLTLNMRNNIIRNEQQNSYAIYTPDTWAGTINSDYNSIYSGTAGARIARIGTTIYNTLPNWQAAGFDLNSNTANPTAGVNGTWVSNSDLHFPSFPTADFQAPSIAVATDIDNETRPLVTVYKGADEPVNVTSSATNWTIFE